MWRERLVLILAVVTTIGCDRVTKHVAATFLVGAGERSYFADVVRLAYAENAGGFLSLGADLPPAVRTSFFTIPMGVMLMGLVAVVVYRAMEGLPVLGLALSAAG